MYDIIQTVMMSPVMGDKFRPWIAAVILIVSVIVLIGLFVFSRKDEDGKEDTKPTYEDEDE